MNLPFDLNTFLHCPQGPRLEGEARVDACWALGQAIEQGRVLTAAQLLIQDPSLIFEKLCAEPNSKLKKPAVEWAIDAGLGVFALFALTHGMSVTDPAFGSAYGLLKGAVHQNSPDLVSCALLYRANPNQRPDSASDQSMLDYVVAVACESAFRPNSSKFVDSIQIAHMLLDAGADTMLPGAVNSAIFALCKEPWKEGSELCRVFEEVMKRTKSVENAYQSRSLINFAINAKNFHAVKFLIAAGAPVDAGKLNIALSVNGLSEHIPTFEVLIEQQQKSPVSNATATVSSGDAVQPNLAPEGFLTLKQCPRWNGVPRADACLLLDMAITLGRFVTAVKLLSTDPSLITEVLGEDGQPKQPAVQKAIAAGMTALVPFALAQGMPVDDPAFGPRGLLHVAVKGRSPILTSYALLDHADPNQLPVSAPEGDAPPVVQTFLDMGVGNVLAEPGSSPVIVSMLLDAEASPCVHGAANTALPQACQLNWANNWAVPVMINRGGSACVDLQSDNKPALRLAAEAGNVDAVAQLVKAGANTDPAFLGADLFALVKAGGGGESLHALTVILMQRQIAKDKIGTLASSVTIVDGVESSPKHNACRVL